MTKPRIATVHRWGVVCCLIMACDGGDPIERVSGRQPSVPGVAAPFCDARTPCEPGLGCVPATRDAGRCLPLGGPGALCAVGVTGQPDACDAGLSCEGKGGTCVPLMEAGQSCTAAACALPFVCDRQGDTDPKCVAPGAHHGACRLQSPVCDQGLGCLAGLCKPLAKEGACFRNGTYSPCPEGQLCSHFFGDPGEAPGQCLAPSIVGGACGDTDLGRPACVPEALCVEGQCRLDAVAPGGTCIVGAPNVRCGNASSCLRNVCISQGTETAPCRPAPSAPCDAGLTCKDQVCRSFIPDGQGCQPNTGSLIDCNGGSSCMRSGSAYVCARDAEEGGACRGGDKPCTDGLVCARGQDGVNVCRQPIDVGGSCSLAREPFEPCTTGASCSKSSRVCERNGSLGAVCDEGVRCANGLWCVPDNGVPRCYPAPPAVAVGQSCDTNVVLSLRTNRCEERAECLAGLCVPWGAQGASCRPLGASGTRCDAGLACVFSVCQPGAPVGAACLPGGDTECASPALCVAAGQSGQCRQVKGYAVSARPRERFIDACEGGAVLAFKSSLFTDAPRDDGDEGVALPFPFTFFGELHESVSIAINGVAGFPAPGSVLNPGSSGVLPIAGQPALIAPFWDDLVATAVSRVCTKPLGQVGRRAFVVTWRRLQRFGHRDSSLTFSLVLHEADSTVTFMYDDLYAPPGFESVVSGVGAAKGLQAPGGFAFVQSNGALSLAQEVLFVPLP